MNPTVRDAKPALIGPSTPSGTDDTQAASVARLRRDAMLLLPGRRRSEITGTVFQFVLFLAAALLLIAVILQSQAEQAASTTVDDPPPAVFVTTD